MATWELTQELTRTEFSGKEPHRGPSVGKPYRPLSLSQPAQDPVFGITASQERPVGPYKQFRPVVLLKAIIKQSLTGVSLYKGAVLICVSGFIFVL